MRAFIALLASGLMAVAVQARVTCARAVSATFQLGAALGDPAGGQLVVPDEVEPWDVARAAFDLELAPGVKRATAGEVDEARREPLDRIQRLVELVVKPRHGA